MGAGLTIFPNCILMISLFLLFVFVCQGGYMFTHLDIFQMCVAITCNLTFIALVVVYYPSLSNSHLSSF